MKTQEFKRMHERERPESAATGSVCRFPTLFLLLLLWFMGSAGESRGEVDVIHNIPVQRTMNPSSPFMDLSRSIGLGKNADGEWTIQYGENHHPEKIIEIEFSMVFGDKPVYWKFGDRFDSILTPSGTGMGFNLRSFIEAGYRPEVGEALSWSTVELFNEITISFMFRTRGTPPPVPGEKIEGFLFNDSPYAFQSPDYRPAPDYALQQLVVAPYEGVFLDGKLRIPPAWSLLQEAGDGRWTVRLNPVNIPKVTLVVEKGETRQSSTVDLPDAAILDAEGWLDRKSRQWIRELCQGLEDADYDLDPEPTWESLPLKTNWFDRNECTVRMRKKPEAAAVIVNTGDVDLVWGEGLHRLEIAAGGRKVIEQARMARLSPASLAASAASPGGADGYDCEVRGPGIVATNRGATNEYRIAARRKALLSIIRPGGSSVEIRNGQGWSTNLAAGTSPIRIAIPWTNAFNAVFSVKWTPLDASTYLDGQTSVVFLQPGEVREVVCQLERRAVTVTIGNSGRVPIEVTFNGKSQTIPPGGTKAWQDVQPGGDMGVRWTPCNVSANLWTGGTTNLAPDGFSVTLEAGLDAEQVSNRIKAIDGRYNALQNKESTEDVSLQPLLNSLNDLKRSGLSIQALPAPLPSWADLKRRMEVRAQDNPPGSPAAETAVNCLNTMLKKPGNNDYFEGWDEFMEWQP